jgi:hypothetical protein
MSSETTYNIDCKIMTALRMRDLTLGALVMLLMAAPALSSVSLAAYGCDTP